MDTETLLETFRARLVRIGIVKALIPAGIFGFGVTAVVAFITWFTYLPLWAVLLLSIGLGVLAACAVAPLLYLKFFRPTTYRVAELIDRLGLEERIITMYELSEDDSYIAKCQRRDAMEKLRKVDEKRLRYNLSRLAVALVAVVFSVALVMTTLASLAAVGVIVRGADLFSENKANTEWCEVNYLAAEHGSIEGEDFQLVEKGKDAKPVTAVADAGYVFLQWSDGVITAARWDYNVKENLTVVASFIRAEGSGGSSDPDSPDDEGDGDPDGENPDDPPESDENPAGDPEDRQDEEDNQDNQDNEDNNNPEGDDKKNDSDSAKVDNNTVIDGRTSYEDAFDYEKNKDDLAGNNELPDDLKGLIGDYLDNLKP